MLKFFMKHKGSVSIMMAIILLPTMALSALLVDLANRNMSKAMVESAGDLAASSALANYDSVLADVYGLFAISQTEKDLKENLTQYFTDTLDAAGLLSAEVENQLIPGLVDAIDLATLNDPLIDVDVEVTEAAGVPNTALSDPHILQGQIIEFMKYRGPVEVGLDLLDMVNALKGMTEKAEVAELDATVNEDLSDIASVEKGLYDAINVCDVDLAVVNDYLQNHKEYWDNGSFDTSVFFDFQNGQYVPVTTFNISEDSVNYQLFNAIYHATFALNYPEMDNYMYDLVPAALKNAYDGAAKYWEKYPDSGWMLASVRQTDAITHREINSHYEPYLEETAWSDLSEGNEIVGKHIYDATSYLTQKNIDKFPNPLAPILNRYTFSFQEKTDVEAFYSGTAESEFMRYLRPLFADMNKVCSEISRLDREINTAGSAGDDDLVKSLEDERTYYGNLKNDLNTAISDADTLLGSYLAYIVAADIYEGILYSSYLGAQKSLTRIHENMERLYSSLETLEGTLPAAIGLAKMVKEELVQLQKDNEALNQGADEYAQKNSPDGYYDKMKETYQTVDAQHSEESIHELIDQLNAINDYLFGAKGLKGKLDRINICGAGNPITDEKLDSDVGVYLDYKPDGNRVAEKYGQKIKHDAETYSYAGISQEQIPNLLYNSDKVTTLEQPEAMTSTSYTKMVREAILGDGFSAGVPAYYLYLQSTYGYGADTDTSDDAAGDLTSTASGKASEANGATSVETGMEYTDRAFDVLEKPDIQKGNGPQQASAGGTQGESKKDISIDADDNTGALKMVKNVFSTTKEMLKVITDPQKLAEGLRDSLLTTEYVYENFSNYMTKVNKDGETFQTMTNVEISPANNTIFGCEVEYILYGDRGNDTEGPQKNVDTVLNRIFLIRMLCNAVFAMTDASVQALTIGPALAIQAATLGVFPYKVAQLVLDVCLALAESIWDLEKIKSGYDVVLVKTWDTWVMGGAGALKDIAEVAVDKAGAAITAEATKAINELSGTLQSYVDKGVNLAEEKVNEAGAKIADDVEAVLISGLKDALSDALSAMTAEVEDIYYSLFQAAENASQVNETYIREKLTNALNDYVNSTDLTPSVKSFVTKYSGTAVHFVMEERNVKIGNRTVSVSGLLQEYSSKMTQVASGQVGTIQFDPKDANSLHQELAKIPADFLREKVDDIEQQAQEWVGDLGDSVQKKLDNGIQELTNEANEKAKELTQEAASNIKAEVNGMIDEYFPQTKAITGEAGETGGASKMLKLGYTDYLRLFLFLGVINSSKRPAMLTRTGEVISLNVKNGLNDYYAAENLPNGHPAGDNFYLNDAYTYVSISANVTIDPLLIDQSFIQQGAERVDETTGAVINPMEGRESIWKYSFTCLAGY